MADDELLFEMLGVYKRPVVPPLTRPKGRPPGRGNQDPGGVNTVPTNNPGKGRGKGRSGSKSARPGKSGGGGASVFPEYMSRAFDFRSPDNRHEVKVPSGTVEGDLLILIHIHDGESSFDASGFGYSVISPDAGAGVASDVLLARIHARYKIATASGNGGWFASTGTSRDAVTATFRIAKDTFDPLVAPVAAAISAERSADPAALDALTPAWGSAKNLWMTFAGHRDNTGVTPTAYPTDYDLMNDMQDSTSAVSAWLAMCAQQFEGTDRPAGGVGWNWPSATDKLYTTIAIKGAA